MEPSGSIPLRASDISGPVDVTERTLPKITKDKILLSGDAIFPTVQGEGPTVGRPCVFIRLHHCNLTCTYCDAWYTWKKESEEFWRESAAIKFSPCAALLNATWDESFPGDIERRVVWTGGEPLMQRKQIDEVMSLLWSDFNTPFWHPEIETNGTLMPTASQLANFQFNCSPKLDNSDNKRSRSVKPKVLDALNKADSTFKFVCRTERDLDEVLKTYGPHVDHDKIIIMPEGVMSSEIDRVLKRLYRPSMARGLRLQGRLQAQFADGAQRGV